jgi:hypothetical protein
MRYTSLPPPFLTLTLIIAVKNTFATRRTNKRIDGLVVVPVSLKHIFDNFLASISELYNGVDWHVEFILPVLDYVSN